MRPQLTSEPPSMQSKSRVLAVDEILSYGQFWFKTFNVMIFGQLSPENHLSMPKTKTVISEETNRQLNKLDLNQSLDRLVSHTLVCLWLCCQGSIVAWLLLDFSRCGWMFYHPWSLWRRRMHQHCWQLRLHLSSWLCHQCRWIQMYR